MTQIQDLRERCSYLLILFKAKDKALFEKYSAELAKVSAEQSTEFYHYLLAEYKKLVEGASPSQPLKPVSNVRTPKKTQKKVVKKKSTPKKPSKKVTKKVAAKSKKKTVKKAKKRK